MIARRDLLAALDNVDDAIAQVVETMAASDNPEALAGLSERLAELVNLGRVTLVDLAQRHITV